MLGYSYEDIQGFGSTLRLAELMAIDKGEPEIKEGLMKIWDFFEGVLAEGYIAEEVGASE
jgi:hypothetical protein